MRRIPLPTVITGVAIVLLLLIYMVTFQVRFNEVAVKVRMGRADESSIIREPGVYFQWPRPFERVEIYDKRLHVLDTQEAEVKTSDGKQLVVGCFAVWRISDPLKFFIRVVSENQAENQLRQRINEVRSAVVGRHALSDFVNLDAEQLAQSHAKIEQGMIDAARESVLRDYGIDLVRVGIRRISLPEQATETVFNAMIEERNKEATGYREAGAARAKAIEAQAQAQADQILSFARTKAQELESAGIQAATRMLEEISAEDRAFFIWLRQLDALEAGLKEKSTLFLDINTELIRSFVQPFQGGEAPQEPPGMPRILQPQVSRDGAVGAP